MDTEDNLHDTANADLDEMRQLRVKVSVRTLVHLQYFRLTQSKGISEVVNDALNAYFAGLDVPGPKAEGTSQVPGASAHVPTGRPTASAPEGFQGTA